MTKPRHERGSERGLDRIDLEILAALQRNARLSNKELAAHVGLAPSSCLQRVRRLTEEGVLRGFHAEVDPSALGIALQALVAVRFRHHERDACFACRDRIAALPEVVAVYHVSGADDLLVHVCVRDALHLRDLVFDRISTHPEIGHLETSIIFHYARSAAMPCFVDVDDDETPRG